MEKALSLPLPTTSPHQRRNANLWVLAMLLLSVPLWTGSLALDLPTALFLPVHTALEFGSVAVALLGFGIAWHARAADRPGNIVLLGAILLGVGLLDFLHTLSYDGMPPLATVASPQKAIYFWLAARSLAALGLLVVALRPWHPLHSAPTRHIILVSVLGYVLLVTWLGLFRAPTLPDFFVPGQGLTPLKIQWEYVLVAVYALAAWLFYRQSGHALNYSTTDLYAAAAIASLSEIYFSKYGRVTDIVNATGHIYKVISYYFIYRAVFVDSVRSPFNALQMALDREKVRAAEQHAFVRTLDLLEEAVLELAPNGRILNANNGWWRLMGLPAAEGSDITAYLHPEDRDAFTRHLDDLSVGRKEEFKGRFRLQVSGRPTQWVECRFVVERDDKGHWHGIRGVLRDITKSYMQERHISHMALHDALTGLPNRVLLEDRLKQAVQQASRSAQHVGVCFIDLDHFKNINDAYGHKTGDSYLLTLAQVLKTCLREVDTLARWGGDEFVVLLPSLSSPDDARTVARKMIDAMRQTIMLDDLAISATFSMGIAIYPEDDPIGDIDRLLAQADRAMFYAKSQGRNNFQLFSDMSSKGLGRKELYIQTRLAQAVRENRITVWFQPLVAAQSDGLKPNVLVGVEALARWHDPELGWIPPASFIPMAENLGLISELGQSVRRQAFAEFHRWQQKHPTLTLSINISKRQLFASDFVDTLMSDLTAHQLKPSALVLEITESVALMDVEFAEERLRQLAQAGFTLALDDFGTGYASLSQLHELPIGELKIDISFVRRVHTPEGLRLVQGIVSLAKALRLRTVAEGVEDAATAHTLAELGVDVLQGFHFGRPMSAEALVSSSLFALER
jgi:diguanylate cyclase (GGDEF)-like protein/PAS domain S-box-containing protein